MSVCLSVCLSLSLGCLCLCLCFCSVSALSLSSSVSLSQSLSPSVSVYFFRSVSYFLCLWRCLFGFIYFLSLSFSLSLSLSVSCNVSVSVCRFVCHQNPGTADTAAAAADARAIRRAPRIFKQFSANPWLTALLDNSISESLTPNSTTHSYQESQPLGFVWLRYIINYFVGNT